MMIIQFIFTVLLISWPVFLKHGDVEKRKFPKKPQEGIPALEQSYVDLC